MRVGVMIGGEILGRQADLKRLLQEARQAEAHGFASSWVPHIFGLDAISALAIVGWEIRQIELGTAVLPTFTRHPFTLAQQADRTGSNRRTVHARCRPLPSLDS